MAAMALSATVLALFVAKPIAESEKTQVLRGMMSTDSVAVYSHRDSNQQEGDAARSAVSQPIRRRDDQPGLRQTDASPNEDEQPPASSEASLEENTTEALRRHPRTPQERDALGDSIFPPLSGNNIFSTRKAAPNREVSPVTEPAILVRKNKS